MSLLAVILIVLLLAAIATFAPLDPKFKNLLYILAVGIVVVYVLLLVFGAVGTPSFGTRRRIVVD